MQKIEPGPSCLLHGTAATRAIEAQAREALPPHTLMQRAGLAIARLALALAPHAQRVWIACGPGNNGGDGMEAALHLHRWGKTVALTWLGRPESVPLDAQAAHACVQAAGIHLRDEPPVDSDFCIDALLGLGASRPLSDRMADWVARIDGLQVPVLAVDLPTGLDADTGVASGPVVHAHHTLSLLTLKPGLFTAQGRDSAGQVWFDDLGIEPSAPLASARLNGMTVAPPRPHASHKGSYGDLAVIGGAPGMTGAALLAARAALHQGAGRVFVGLLDGGSVAVDLQQPELMFRSVETLASAHLTVVCGCGGGSAVAAQLPRLLSATPRLVLDADALNAIAADSQLQTLLQARRARGRQTVLTPHPLEAARLLTCSTAAVQQDRLAAAQQLADRFGACVVLKGSGTVIAAPGTLPVVNPSGNARLATAGTGDVLAGMAGARLAAGAPAFAAACEAAYLHGQAADRWPADQALTASRLACAAA